MGKRPASSKATRGAGKGKKPISSSLSNPKTNKFRSQYNNLAFIAQGGPSKRAQNRKAIENLTKSAIDRKKLLDGIDSINMVEEKELIQTKNSNSAKKSSRKSKGIDEDDVSVGSRVTTASFASVWSNCTNISLNDFFQVWNPNLETHKDALAVIAGLSQIMNSSGSDPSDSEYAKKLFKILSSPDTPSNVLTGALLALTFVIRKLPDQYIVENFDSFYPVLKNLMEQYHTSKKKTLVKSLIRCFASLSKAHPLGKAAIETNLRKKINAAIRQHKVQNKISL